MQFVLLVTINNDALNHCIFLFSILIELVGKREFCILG